MERDRWRDFLTATTRGTLGRYMSGVDRELYEDEDPAASDVFRANGFDVQSDAYDDADDFGLFEGEYD